MKPEFDFFRHVEEVINCRYLGQLGHSLGQLKQVSTWGLPGTKALPVVDVWHLTALGLQKT